MNTYRNVTPKCFYFQNRNGRVRIHINFKNFSIENFLFLLIHLWIHMKLLEIIEILSLCVVLSPIQLFMISSTVTCQALLSMRFPRQEYWSGLPFFLWLIFLTQGSNLCLRHWQADSLPRSHLGSPEICCAFFQISSNNNISHPQY